MIITFVDRFFKHHFTITPRSKCDGQYSLTHSIRSSSSSFWLYHCETENRAAASFDKRSFFSSSGVYLLFFHINTNFKKKRFVSDRCAPFWDIGRSTLTSFGSEGEGYLVSSPNTISKEEREREKNEAEISKIRAELTNLNFALHFSSYSYRQSMKDPHSPPPRSEQNKVKDRQIIVYKRSSKFEGQQFAILFGERKTKPTDLQRRFSFRSNCNSMSHSTNEDPKKVEGKRNQSIQ